jgi:hypothetical protein
LFFFSNFSVTEELQLKTNSNSTRNECFIKKDPMGLVIK